MALLIACYAVGVRFLIWRGSGFAGEDAYITMRYAENLAHGQGFVFNPGERVQGSTTPLGTIIVALGVLVGFDAMAFSRAIGILADGVTAFVIARWLARPAYDAKWAGACAAILWALDRASHEVAASGMETPLVTLVGALGFWGVLERRPALLALCGGALLVLRIDTVPLVLILVFGARLRGIRFSPQNWVILCAPFLLWTLFSAIYFGSPVPNSLRAKLWAYPPSLSGSLDGFQNQFGGSLGKLSVFLCGLGALLLLAQLIRARSFSAAWWRDERAVLLLAFGWMVIYYSALIAGRRPVFYWYLIPPRPIFWMLLIWPFHLALKSAFGALHIAPAWKTSFGLLSLLAAMMAAGQWQIQRVVPVLAAQQGFYDAVIPPLTRFLQNNMGDDERILLEPIGYVGYFSRRRVLDLVGLVSPEVESSYRTSKPLADMLARLQPEWLCLRPGEVAWLKKQDPALPDKLYHLKKTFLYNREPAYLIFQRKPELTTATLTAPSNDSPSYPFIQTTKAIKRN